MVASQSKHVEIVKILLAAGANPNLQDMYGRTALTSASEVGYLEIVKILLAAGANVNHQAKESQYFLRYFHEILNYQAKFDQDYIRGIRKRLEARARAEVKPSNQGSGLWRDGLNGSKQSRPS